MNNDNMPFGKDKEKFTSDSYVIIDKTDMKWYQEYRRRVLNIKDEKPKRRFYKKKKKN